MTRTTVQGLLVLLPNPCTTQPCLPGLALAVRGDARDGQRGLWYLQRGGGFVTDPAEIPGRPQLGIPLRISGTLRPGRDVHGEVYQTLQVDGAECGRPG